MKSSPFFSFIVTCYNGERFVRPCLDSILKQDFPQDRYEVLFIDDGSTDRSREAAAEFAGKIRNLRMHRIENSGLEKACNYGFREAQNDFLIRVDVDDLLAPGFLAAMDQAIVQRPAFDFYYCKNYYEYYDGGREIFKSLPEFNKDEIFERGDFFATATVYRKKDLVQAGFYSEEIKNCGLENYNLILRFLTAGKVGLAVEGAAFYYRRHLTNMSTVKRDAIIEYGKILLKKYQREYKTNTFHPYGLKLESVKESP